MALATQSIYAAVRHVGRHLDSVPGYDISATTGEALDFEIHVFLVLFSGSGVLPLLQEVVTSLTT